MPRGSLTALFGADARNDEAADAVLNEPDIEAAADKRAVAAFVKDRVRGERELSERHHIAGGERKARKLRREKFVQRGFCGL